VFIFGGSSPAAHGSGSATAPTLAPTRDGTVFTLDSSASEASFTIGEVLFGQPNTVVGTTNAVAGQILVNRSDPSKSQLGEIRVDLSAMKTDNDFRNRALQGRIFETGDAANQYATFIARSITGLPSSATVGQAVSFKITGDLAIHQVTRSVTFDVQLTPQSQTACKGQATATVRYKDYNLAIPSVPSVAGVSDDVKLALTFTARA
jgi:polyisoprenoid-binding protein YceI